MTSEAAALTEFQVSLIGYWVPFDPGNPLPGTEYDEVRGELDRLGFGPPTFPAGTRSLLTAAMFDDAGTEEEPDPIYATVIVVQHDGSMKVKLDSDGAIVPTRQTRRKKFEWPGGNVGEVEMHEVDYTIPHPEAATFVTVTFTTPNLPRIDEMEWIFDTIVGTSAWVAPLSPEERLELRTDDDH